MSVTFGRTSPKQFAEYDPDTSSWRTWPDIGLWGSTPFSGTWPRSGMTRSGRAFELPTSAPLTEGNGSSSLLPTPIVGGEGGNQRSAEAIAEGRGQVKIHDLPRLLPTPIASDRNQGRTVPDKRLGWQLRDAVVVELLPTPEANTASNGGSQHPDKRRAGGHSVNLQDVAEHLLPTPTAQASKHSADGRGSGTLDDFNLWSVATRLVIQGD